jgi:hypothetical protein
VPDEENFPRNYCIDIALLTGAYFAASVLVSKLIRAYQNPIKYQNQ